MLEIYSTHLCKYVFVAFRRYYLKNFRTQSTMMAQMLLQTGSPLSEEHLQNVTTLALTEGIEIWYRGQ